MDVPWLKSACTICSRYDFLINLYSQFDLALFSFKNSRLVCIAPFAIRRASCLNDFISTGKAWISDYGSPDDPKDFDFIYPISPVHNVPTDKVLPPCLLLTADRSFSSFS